MQLKFRYDGEVNYNGDIYKLINPDNLAKNNDISLKRLFKIMQHHDIIKNGTRYKTGRQTHFNLIAELCLGESDVEIIFIVDRIPYNNRIETRDVVFSLSSYL